MEKSSRFFELERIARLVPQAIGLSHKSSLQLASAFWCWACDRWYGSKVLASWTKNWIYSIIILWIHPSYHVLSGGTSYLTSNRNSDDLCTRWTASVLTKWISMDFTCDPALWSHSWHCFAEKGEELDGKNSLVRFKFLKWRQWVLKLNSCSKHVKTVFKCNYILKVPCFNDLYVSSKPVLPVLERPPVRNASYLFISAMAQP